MDPRVDDRVRRRAQVELPVVEEQRRIVGPVTCVHHHLRDVDGPSLVEETALEDATGKRRCPVGVDALEVVTGHRLMDRQ